MHWLLKSGIGGHKLVFDPSTASVMSLYHIGAFQLTSIQYSLKTPADPSEVQNLGRPNESRHES